MVHTVALEQLWLFYHPKERHEFPSSDHRFCQDQPPPAPDISKGIWYVFITLGSLSLILATCSKPIHLADTQPYSPTTLA